MEINTPQKVKTGMFVTIGFFILLVFIFLIGSQKNLFTSTFSLSGQFKNVSGLVIGSTVRLGGINVGVVDEIQIINDTIVKVDLVIDRKVKKYIKSDAKISIGSDGLMGDKIVVIGGGGQGKEINNNAFLSVKNPMDTDRLLVRLDSIATNADILVSNVADIFGKINRGEGSVGRLLNENKLAKDLEKTVNSTNNTIKKVGENMDAAKNSFLLKGYFKKKERAKDKKEAEKLQQEEPKIDPK